MLRYLHLPLHHLQEALPNASKSPSGHRFIFPNMATKTVTLTIVTLLVTCLAVGSQAGITASPTIIEPKHTKTLTLNCSHPNPETTAITKIEIRKVGEEGNSQTIASRVAQVPIGAPPQQQPQPQQPQQQRQYTQNVQNGYAVGNSQGGGVPGGAGGRGGGGGYQQSQQQQQQPQGLGGFPATYRKTNNFVGGAATGYGNAMNSGYKMMYPAQRTFRKKRSVENGGDEDDDNKSFIDRKRRHADDLDNSDDDKINEDRDVGAFFDLLNRRKRNSEASTPMEASQRRKRSIFVTHRRFTRDQNSLTSATLGGGDFVHLVPNVGRFKGEGRMASPAYLTVEISAPDAGDSGRYVCTIAHMESKNGKVEDEFDVDVSVTDVDSLSSIEDRVVTLEGQIPAMAAMGKEMRKLLEDDTKRSQELQDQIDKLKKENQDLVAVVDELKEKFQTLTDRTTALMEAQSAQAAVVQASVAAAAVPVQNPMAPKESSSSSSSSSSTSDAKGEAPKNGSTAAIPSVDSNANSGANNQNDNGSPQQNGGVNGMQGNNNNYNNMNPGTFQNGGFQNNNMYGQYPQNAAPMGQWGNMPQQQPFNGYNGGFYQNNGYMGYGQQPMMPQHQQQPQQQQPPQQQQLHGQQQQQQAPLPQQQPQQPPMINNGQFGGMQRPMYGNGFVQPGFGQYGNMNGFNRAPMNTPHLKSDDLSKITARMDDLENTRISALENDLKDVKENWVQPMSSTVGEMEIYMNVTVKAAMALLQSVDLQGLVARVDTVEKDAIPTIVYNLTVTEKDIGLLKDAVEALKGRETVPNDKVVELLGQIEKDEEGEEDFEGKSAEEVIEEVVEEEEEEDEKNKRERPPQLFSTLGTFEVAKDKKHKKKKDA